MYVIFAVIRRARTKDHCVVLWRSPSAHNIAGGKPASRTRDKVPALKRLALWPRTAQPPLPASRAAAARKVLVIPPFDLQLSPELKARSLFYTRAAAARDAGRGGFALPGFVAMPVYRSALLSACRPSSGLAAPSRGAFVARAARLLDLDHLFLYVL